MKSKSEMKRLIIQNPAKFILAWLKEEEADRAHLICETVGTFHSMLRIAVLELRRKPDVLRDMASLIMDYKTRTKWTNSPPLN